MPDDFLKAMGYINPALGAAEAIANPLMAHLTNVANRKFTREMYQRQRSDALADWEMQNQYNSPRAQMQRFQEAGLNPNLIYGQMQAASPVRSSSSSGGQASAPRIDSSGAINASMAAVAMEQRSAQADLLRKNLDVADADIQLKRMQALAALGNANLSDARIKEILQLVDQKGQLFPGTLQGQALTNEQKAASIVQSWHEDTRRTYQLSLNAALNAKTIDKLGAEIGRIFLENMVSKQQFLKVGADTARVWQEIENMKKDGTLKDFDIQYRKAGNNPNDPALIKTFNDIQNRLKDQVPVIKPWQGQSRPLELPKN